MCRQKRNGGKKSAGPDLFDTRTRKTRAAGPNQELADGKGTKTLSRLYSCNSFLDIDDLSL
jgi:hypothetical protein